MKQPLSITYRACLPIMSLIVEMYWVPGVETSIVCPEVNINSMLISVS